MAASESAFWQFSLRFYAREGVPPLCLALQDGQGVDVNILLLLLFLSLHRRRLGQAETQQIDAASAAWRARAVQPLRALRRDLKQVVPEMDPRDVEALRSDIKRCELQAERLQQEMLERVFFNAGIGTASAGTVPETAAANLATYGPFIGSLSSEAVQALLALFEAEFAADAMTRHT